MLLAVVIGGLLLTSGILAWRLRKAQDEVDAIRNKHGELVVRDESKVHVRTKENVDGALYKIDVFIPEGKEYQMTFAVEDVPAAGLSKEQRLLASLVEGVNEITVTKFEREDKVVLEFKLQAGQQTNTQSVQLPAAAWLDKSSQEMTEWLGGDTTDAVDATPGVTLLRKRRLTAGIPAGSSAPSPGILIELVQKK